MKPWLFIDRDGTLIHEPDDYQIDSWEKFRYLPGVITWLGRIARELPFELIMVTNQDGLGTPSFPEETFWPVQHRLVETLAGEGIRFEQIHIDPHFESENHPNRKPGTGMLSEYLKHPERLSESYVIGDRKTDIQLARNLGCNAIYISSEQDPGAALSTTSWEDIYLFLKHTMYSAAVTRVTTETAIHISLQLHGEGKASIHTGIGFFDHMLEQVARHGILNLDIKVNGDLHIDEHHTIEDTAIALGEAFNKALGTRKGIFRYGFTLPMDDCLATVAVDFGGRPWCTWDAQFLREKIGDMPSEMFFHFFKSFSDAARCNLAIQAVGDNEHHKIEAIFKAFARAIRMAVQNDGSGILPSTKGIL